MKKKITATVLSQKEIAPRIFDMWIATELAACAKAGQFIGVYPKDRRTGYCGVFLLSGRRQRRDFGNSW